MNRFFFTRWPVLSLFLIAPLMVQGAFNDWAEGLAGKGDGATRDYYNRAARLAWKHYLGDWRDAENRPQGNKPYVTEKLIDNDTPRFVEWEVTSLVQEWLEGRYPNQGMLLRGIEGKGSFHFRSREYEDIEQCPRLILTISNRTLEFIPTADTYLEPSTYRGQGKSETLRIT